MARELRQILKGTVQTVQSGLTNVQTAVLQQYSSAAFYPTNLEQLDQIKCGWLRFKPGSAGRSWHRRWFLLKDTRLYYYSSEEDCSNGKPPAGSLYLPGNHVCEVPYNPSADAEKFVFEIQPGDGIRSASHEAHLLMAESDDDRRDWLRAIRQILYQKSGGAIFGQSLDLTLMYEPKRDKFRKVPELVQTCVEFLKQRGLDEEGIFRLPGRNILIRRLSDLYDRAMRPSLTDVQLTDDGPVQVDVHSVASLLKSYLRELPEPLVPFDVYESVIHIVAREREIGGEEVAIGKLSKLMTDSRAVPPSNYNTLQYICEFLAEVARHSDVNKMNTVNLATVFVQSFIRPDVDDPGLMLATSTQRTLATQILISSWDRIFTAEYTADGSSIILGDLLGLDSSDVFSTAGTPVESASDGISADLAGLDFGCPSPVRTTVVFRPDVMRRQSAARSNNSSYRTGMIEGDQNFLQQDEKTTATPTPTSANADEGYRKESNADPKQLAEFSPPPPAETNGTSTPNVRTRPRAALRNSISFNGALEKGQTAPFTLSNSPSASSVIVGPVPVPPPKPSRIKAAAAKLQASVAGANATAAAIHDAADDSPVFLSGSSSAKSNQSDVAIGLLGSVDGSPITATEQRPKKFASSRSSSVTSAAAWNGTADDQTCGDDDSKVDSLSVRDANDSEPGSSCSVPAVETNDVPTLLRQLEQLTARLQVAERERDDAVLRVRELEDQLKLGVRGSSGS